MMSRFDWTIIGYALILMVGGVTGYAIAGSIASLLMSSIFAILLIGSLFLTRFYPERGVLIINMLLAALLFFFGYRWYSTQFFPAGFLSLVTLAVLITAFFFQKKK